MLEIKNLKVNVEDKEILKGIDLKINKGEIHVVMGPNGAGKSTLTNAIMAHPKYSVEEGQIFFEGEDITEMAADERAKLGIFMSYQTPQEVPGISVENFLRAAKMAVTGENVPILKFRKELKEAMKELSFDQAYSQRYLNVGFSGGEKKKNEILQMKILDPKFVMLDETDSGLDVDATKIVSEGVKNFLTEDKSVLIITHHSQILEYLNPDFVHIVVDGKLVKTGGPELIEQIENEGYKAFREGEINE
ncbi:MAG: Fe-S cluster assembly ATPase SufC [Tissierellia bacterium]|nr:Fe-S cluster assembly ATPase SufC [Tissierellia bacterium]